MGTRMTRLTPDGLGGAEELLLPLHATDPMRLMQRVEGYVCEAEHAHPPKLGHPLILGVALLSLLPPRVLRAFGTADEPTKLLSARELRPATFKRRNRIYLLPKSHCETFLLTADLFEQAGLIVSVSLPYSAGLVKTALRLLSKNHHVCEMGAPIEEDHPLIDAAEMAGLAKLFDLVAAIRDPAMPDRLRATALASIFEIPPEDNPFESLPYATDEAALAETLGVMIDLARTHRKGEKRIENV